MSDLKQHRDWESATDGVAVFLQVLTESMCVPLNSVKIALISFMPIIFHSQHMSMPMWHACFRRQRWSLSVREIRNKLKGPTIAAICFINPIKLSHAEWRPMSFTNYLKKLLPFKRNQQASSSVYSIKHRVCWP